MDASDDDGYMLQCTHVLMCGLGDEYGRNQMHPWSLLDIARRKSFLQSIVVSPGKRELIKYTHHK
eukprot:919272-Amorphochlora_amoeboformis.AAC.1